MSSGLTSLFLFQRCLLKNKNNTVNARSYTMFANAISSLLISILTKSLEMVCMIAKGCFGDDWVSGQFVQFIQQ